MRLILSRKGFDSSVGGVASPVFPDGTMISLPIPLASAPLRYQDVTWRGEPIGPLVEALTKGRIGRDHPAHLDPDLHAAALQRSAGWRPAFGQVAAAQTHLAGRGVGPGDLFLFFGWFQPVEPGGPAGIRFLRTAPHEHVVFGWLQVGEVLAVGDGQAQHRRLRPWLAQHPHLNAHPIPSNTVYVAADRLVIGGRDMGLPGGGAVPRYHDGLRLTASGRNRSIWRLPGWMHPSRHGMGSDHTALSYHTAIERWTDAGDTCLLASVAQGQEFVTTVSDASAADWVMSMLGRRRSAPREQTISLGPTLF